MLSVSGCLLNGSVGELSRWRRMMDLSMMFPEGSITGSVMSVSISGSVGIKTRAQLVLHEVCSRNNRKGDDDGSLLEFSKECQSAAAVFCTFQFMRQRNCCSS